MINVGIRWKLAATYFLIIAGTLLFANWFVLSFLEKDYFRAREASYLAHANIIASTGADYLQRQDHYARYLARDFGSQVQARVLILDRQGTVFVDSFSEGWLEGRHLGHSEVRSALAGGSGVGKHYLEPDGWTLYVAVPVVRQKEIIGAVMLSADVNDIYDSLGAIRQRLLLISLTGGALALLLSLWLAGAMARPVKELTAAAEKMARGRLRQRVRVRGRDEISQLAHAFNTLSDRLEKMDRARVDFIANASHELKSPLGSMKALAESLIYSSEKDIVVYREYLRDIDSEIDRLNRLIQELLYLMKLEEEGAAPRRETVQVGEVIEEVAGRLGPKAARREVDLTWNWEGELAWPADRELVARIIYNLVDNGIKYSPAGGSVHIHGAVAGAELVLQVRDSGEGIPAGDLPHIFDRFYRVDKARSRETGGTGLGLSIVQKAVKMLGGSIGVASEAGRGSLFEVRLPGDVPI